MPQLTTRGVITEHTNSFAATKRNAAHEATVRTWHSRPDCPAIAASGARIIETDAPLLNEWDCSVCSDVPPDEIIIDPAERVPFYEPPRGDGSGRKQRQERTNRYPGKCQKCGGHVDTEAGLLVGGPGNWGVEHRPGGCPAQAQTPAADRPARTNRYGGNCRRCGQYVEAEAGALVRVGEGTAVQRTRQGLREAPTGSWAVEHVGECPARTETPPAEDLPDVPAGHYAIPSTGDNDLAFYRVDRPTDGNYAGRTFVKLVVGGHPDQNVKRSHVPGILARIAADPDAAARRYGQHIGSCARCNRHLTVLASRTAGFGPDCRELLGIPEPTAADKAAFLAAFPQVRINENEEIV